MPNRKSTHIGWGQGLLAVVLIALLVVTAFWAISAWNVAGDIEIGAHGWIALGLGTFFSLLVGCGLMALMFFSSRGGYDEAADPFRRKQNYPRDDANP